MHGREESVLYAIGSQHNHIEQMVLCFQDYCSLSCDYGYTDLINHKKAKIILFQGHDDSLPNLS